MRSFSFSIIDVAWPAAAGAVMAVSVIPINAAALGIWLLFLVRRYRRLGRPSLLLVQCGTLGLILAVAALAPVKIAQQYLGRSIRLGTKQMTLQQLDAYVASLNNRDQVPIRMAFHFAEEDKDKTVEWPSEQMTLHEFVAGIESQTTLRHRFVHCGNGWTLLWGGDCCSALSIYDPQLFGPSPRKRYEGVSW